jgi:DNA-binding CsgD family transcriptional regulator
MDAVRPGLESSIHLAYLDAEGTIIDVSEGWRRFVKSLQPAESDCGIGRSYFDYCQDEALQADVRTLLRSSVQTAAFVYPHPLPTHNRWFVAIGLACPAGAKIRAIVAHLDVTRWVPQTMTVDLGAPLAKVSSKTLMNNILAPLQQSIADALISHFGHKSTPQSERANLEDKLATLTRRQRQVLYLIADGKSNLEIAHKLECSLNTVKRHVAALLQKLNVKNRMQAAALINGEAVRREPRWS